MALSHRLILAGALALRILSAVAVWTGTERIAAREASYGFQATLLVKGQPFPSLIDVTLDDLVEGLESGLFTSVDLVKVRRHPTIPISRRYTDSPRGRHT